jgi:hypothetical protein
LADHWRESYVGETGKSMKAGDLAEAQKGLLAKDRHITLFDRVVRVRRLSPMCNFLRAIVLMK